MDMQMLKPFLMLCVLINGSLLILWSVLWVCARDFIYKMHDRWFCMSADRVNMAMYLFLGVYKVFFLFFNLVPYIVVSMVS